jgi:biofilm PGA synthesis N-glycosyltransferase PgaC
MNWVFWVSAAFVIYTYLGYPAWLWVRGHWRPRSVRRDPYSGAISMVMVVRNEAAVLEGKLRNLMKLNDPAGWTEIIVVSDGSTDRTNDILSEFAQATGLRTILNERPRGKAAGLNDAMRAARGDLVIFMDARQEVELDAVRLLAEDFADPTIGCASGELMLGNLRSEADAAGMGLYWKVEKKIRELEALSGSTIGATGALYGVRRSLLVDLPEETILDDVFIPMHVLRQGMRTILDSRARVWDVPDQGGQREFARKVRTLSGVYQLIQLAPWLLTRSNPARFEFVSHKLMRLFVPFALGALLAGSFLIPGPLYRVALVLQLLFYGLGVWRLLGPGKGPVARVADAALTFIILNTAALVAFANFVTGREIAWAGEGRKEGEFAGSGG